MTPDPIGLVGGVNLYTYAANNPGNFVDPEGKIIKEIVIGGAAVIIGAGIYYVHKHYVAVKEASKTAEIIPEMVSHLE